ncbi:zf-HC2 domain-containing protein [Rosistilla oblonga]|uniref:Putative zinc-finger domain-containing protein n=1 Tax=Rosistilla oblonga TaxID=2527990 RepID=A0A518IT80_9BACT|nr:zf-HC2 domain-containing protein [Rosistilla oblonga]QDV56304.1 hypothetical protein Mal33_22860 [Rosistilla oblonga]
MKVFWSQLLRVLTLQCDDASRLMSDSLDRRLTLSERLAVGGHLLACRACCKLKKQFQLIGAACHGKARPTAANPPAGLPPEAAQRIQQTLREHL